MKKTALLFAIMAMFTFSLSAQSFFKEDTLAIKEIKDTIYDFKCGTVQYEDYCKRWDQISLAMIKKAGNLKEALIATDWTHSNPENPVYICAIKKAEYLAFTKIVEAKTAKDVDDVISLCEDYGLYTVGKDDTTLVQREKLWIKEQEAIIDARNK